MDSTDSTTTTPAPATTTPDTEAGCPLRAVIYTQLGCSLCGKVRKVLQGKGYEIEERDAEDLLGGHDQDMDAMAQLAMQGMELPLVMIDGDWVKPKGVLAWRK